MNSSTKMVSKFGLKTGLMAVIIAFSFSSMAQTIDVGPPDTSICNGDPIDLFAVTTGFGGGGGGGAVTPTTVSLTDDQHSGVLNMGFDFDYYGITYNQCVISSNSYVTFDLTQAGNGSAWSINAAAPNPGMTPTNKVMFPYQDTNPGVSGTISYVTCGEAPYRVFIVDFFEVAMFSCTDLFFTNQVKFFETSNRIEMHITEKPLCANWNGGAAIQGIENVGASLGAVVAGRNFPTQWTANADAYEFIPNGGNYDVNPIAFDPAPLANSSIIWTDATGTVLGTTNTINVSPSTPTWYWATAELPCNVGVEVVDSILVTIGNVNMVVDSINPSCIGFDDGGVFIDPTGSVFPVDAEVVDAATLTTQLSMANVSGPITLGTFLGSGLAAGAYIASVTDAVGCVTQVNFTVNDPAPLTFTTETSDATCFGYADGYVIVEQDGFAIAPITFGADSGGLAAQITGVTNFDTIFGLLANDYTIVMLDANNCPGVPVDVTIDQPTKMYANAGHEDILCFGETNGRAWATPTGSVSPYEMVWDDQFQQTTDTIEFLGAGIYSIHVTDDHQCFTDTTLVVEQPDLLVVELTTGEDTCELSNAFIRSNISGGMKPYTYIWSSIADSANFVTDSANFFNVITAMSAGDYQLLVIDSNACEVEASTTIPLIPSPQADFLTRSKPEEIVDPFALFANNSTMALTYEWQFGDGTQSFEENPDHEFIDTAGTFLVMLIAQNEPEYGCADTAWQYVDVAPYFTFYVPSGFTPDGDGLNDYFGPQGNHFDYETYRMTIYDRWGSVIYMTDNPDRWWDGKNRKTDNKVKDGVYVYVFEVKKFNTFEPKVIKGTITVHRQHQTFD